jgi:hypothetical protein
MPATIRIGPPSILRPFFMRPAAAGASVGAYGPTSMRVAPTHG